MRRHVGMVLSAALLLTSVAPVAAREPVEVHAAPSTSPTPVVEPSPSTQPTPALEPVPEPATERAPTVGTEPATAPDVPAASSDDADPTGRWIVVYRDGTNVSTSSARLANRVGFTAEQTFSHAFRGFTARLTTPQVDSLRKDASVLAVVPDEKIFLTAQAYPTGINRVGARSSAAAKIDGVDERINADVAIVDTGISKVADLNVAGGYNCSTSNRGLWRDAHGHGTHVAGTVGAVDNGSGVVGVAPGVRLWAVKILNDNGEGLLSWYVCGLDWIAAQRDPTDPSLPRFESVNMSVAKSGRDDHACGTLNQDVLHRAICRLVDSGVTVVAAAANDSANASTRIPASYDEVITVSALADTDGKPGGLGGNRCFSWGSYDSDDTFANFSNYGADVDLIAPGKCIWSTLRNGSYGYMSGTSMAAPHVAGAVALLRAGRPYLTPGEVKEALQYLGTLNWKVTSDPDSTHEKLLDVSRLGPRGTFSLGVGPAVTLPEGGGTAAFAVMLTRSATSFERAFLRADDLPPGVRATFEPSTLYGFGGVATTMSLDVPRGVLPGTYPIKVVAAEHGNGASTTATLVVMADTPTAGAPRTDAQPRAVIGDASVPARIAWPAATDPTNPIAGYELQSRLDGGAWSSPTPFGGTILRAVKTQAVGRAYQYRIRARDKVGNWSAWAEGPSASSAFVQDSSSAIVYTGSWTKHTNPYASGGTERYATANGARATTTFSGHAIAIVAPMGPTRGSANAYIDGVYAGTMHCQAVQGQSRLVMFSRAFSGLGTHTIELRVVGNGRVDLDTFITFR